MGWVFGALQLGIVLLTLACARTSRPDRNYWPMVRIIFAAIAAVNGGTFVGNLTSHGATPNPVARVVFNAAMLAAMLYALWFIRKRNATPRFIRLTLGGDFVVMTIEEIDQAVNIAESAAHHGTLTPERAASMRAALAEWERKRAWAAGLQQQVRARRARQGGVGR